MERMSKKFFSIAAMLAVVAAQANEVTPTLVLRSQGFHGDRQKWVGEVGHINLYDMESWYGTLDVGVGYMRSFRDNRIAFALFGDDLNCNDCEGGSITISGSQTTNRGANDWLADYLYLPCNFTGSFSISPRIQNVVVDLDFYLGLDEWVNGMYFRVYGPINWTKWTTGFCTTNNSLTSTATCAAGNFTPSGSEPFLATIESYFAGNAPATTEGVTFNALRYAKLPNCETTETGFADLRLLLGWNFLQDEDYNLGVYIQAAAPTGNKRHAGYVMQPVVGNGKHWELGGGLTGQYVFWRSEDEEKHFGFYFDACLSHLFDAKEQRTFDLDGLDNSRYMLASQFAKNAGTDIPSLMAASSATAASTNPATAGTTSLPAYSFNSQFTPVANLTTVEVDVSIGVQADVVAMFNFTSRGFSWDLGYNFWGRNCESFDCPSSCDPCNPDDLFNNASGNSWALKGDAKVFGYDVTTASATPQAQAVPLSATESIQGGATIHGGTNAGQTTGAAQNYGVDNPRFAYGSATAANGTAALISLPSAQGGVYSTSLAIKTSNAPILLKSSDVALVGTRGISNTVFTHLSYTWDRDNWSPYLGLGGSAEFGDGESCGGCDDSCNVECSQSCDECVKFALSQWAVWVKGGLSFN